MFRLLWSFALQARTKNLGEMHRKNRGALAHGKTPRARSFKSGCQRRVEDTWTSYAGCRRLKRFAR